MRTIPDNAIIARPATSVTSCWGRYSHARTGSRAKRNRPSLRTAGMAKHISRHRLLELSNRSRFEKLWAPLFHHAREVDPVWPAYFNVLRVRNSNLIYDAIAISVQIQDPALAARI